MNAKVVRACIMGHPVAHSRSPMLHGYWLRTLGIEGAYEFADVAPDDFETFFRGLGANGFAGGNITIPHKEAAYRLVDRRERAADAIGAVNTVWYEGGALIGGNTDWLGVVGSLDDIHPGWDASPGKAVVLGAGGSARASVFAFLERGYSVAIVNRTRDRAGKLAAAFGARASAHGYDALPDLLADADILINNTSLGQAKLPSPAEAFGDRLRCGLCPARNRAAQGCEARGPPHRRWLEHAALSGGAGLRALVRRHAGGHPGTARDSRGRHSRKERRIDVHPRSHRLDRHGQVDHREFLSRGRRAGA